MYASGMQQARPRQNFVCWWASGVRGPQTHHRATTVRPSRRLRTLPHSSPPSSHSAASFVGSRPAHERLALLSPPRERPFRPFLLTTGGPAAVHTLPALGLMLEVDLLSLGKNDVGAADRVQGGIALGSRAARIGLFAAHRSASKFAGAPAAHKHPCKWTQKIRQKKRPSTQE